MKIGLIIYSYTNNTLFIGQELEKKLKAADFDVVLERVIAKKDDEVILEKIELTSSPKTDNYDLIVFASPVRGFSLPPVMVKYLSSISTLKNQKVLTYVTQGLPKDWMGGNRTIRQMERFCQEVGATLLGHGIIHWNKKDRESKINELTSNFIGLINEKK